MSNAPRVNIVLYPGVQSLDVTGPLEALAAAGKIAGRPYEIQLIAAKRGAVECSSGLKLIPNLTLGEAGEPIDTLLVPGGFGVREAVADKRLVGWIADAAERSRRITSVCTGAFMLAEAGLLDGRRATTHWASCERLANTYPLVSVDEDAIYVRDEEIWTSAGVTAGIDLALALVEEDHGRDVALEVARWLVMFVQRPGGQTQFSAQLSAQMANDAPIRELQTWIGENPAADLSVNALADRAAMSPRNFARVFGREIGVTPAAYVESVRTECARRSLETTNHSVDKIARDCGFGSAETMRRTFQRLLGVGPTAYRSRFRPALKVVA
jgi:transcriptional regulator GlxA family with amidase domain